LNECEKGELRGLTESAAVHIPRGQVAPKDGSHVVVGNSTEHLIDSEEVEEGGGAGVSQHFLTKGVVVPQFRVGNGAAKLVDLVADNVTQHRPTGVIM
jgi:hypothetical protein